MNFAIIDDDKSFGDALKSYINELCKSEGISHVTDTYTCADDDFLSEAVKKYDVILLDIEMPQQDGLAIADKINSMKSSDTPYIIFVTAKDNLVFDALRKAPYSFVRKSHLEDLGNCIHTLAKKLSNTLTYQIKSGRDIKSLEISSIIHLEKQGNYIIYHTTSENLQERGAMDEKYKDLKQYGFVRPGSSSLINAAYITEFSTKVIKLSDDTEISVSRSYSRKLRTEFNEWMVKTKWQLS